MLLGWCGIVGATSFWEMEQDRYSSEIAKIEQERNEKYAAFKSRFVNAIAQDRENQAIALQASSDNTESTNEYIASLLRHPEGKSESLSFMGKPYYLVNDAVKLNKYNVLDTTTNVIYPGAIIKGDSLFRGNNYTVIETERAPIDIISNQTGGTVKSISNPNYSNVILALNQYAETYAGDVSKEWTYELQSISHTDELNINLGIGVGDFQLGVGLDSSEQQSTIAVVYTQIYYTVSTEPKKSASDYFKEGADLKILGVYEPAYVSSVDYGRKIILLVSGELSEKELSAKLDALIDGVQIGIAIGKIQKDEKLNCQIITYGGADMAGILQTSDKNKGIVGEVKEWLWGGDDNDGVADRLNDFLINKDSLINPVPVSYRLKYLSDNEQVPAMYIKTEEIAFPDLPGSENFLADEIYETEDLENI